MDSPAQQPEVIKPINPPPNAGSSTTTPSPNSASKTPPAFPPSSPFDKLKSLPKNIKIAIGLGVALFILLLLSFAGTTAINMSKPKPTPTPIFANKPTPSPAPTDSWRIYSNEKYGFEIKYPHEFTLAKTLEDQKFEYSEGIDLKNFNRVTRFKNPNATWVQIEALYMPNEITNVAQWVKSDFPAINRNGTSSGELKNILQEKASGQEIVTFENGDRQTRKNAIFYKDKRMIILTLFPIAENGGSYTDIKESANYLKQILSTFRFTEISFIPINQNVLFELPSDWKVLEETRDRLYISNLNATKVIRFFKKTNISSAELNNEATKKMVSNIQNQSTSIGGKYAGEVSGCQKAGACNRLYSITVTEKDVSYLIQYENNSNDTVFNEILKNVTIK